MFIVTVSDVLGFLGSAVVFIVIVIGYARARRANARRERERPRSIPPGKSPWDERD